MEPVPERPNFAKNEEEILKLWEEKDAFQTSLKLNADKPVFTFYDGPPFATGLPHYGHILTGTIKDIITRYAHQTGHSVSRRFGWDCHGLPIEFEIDKIHGFKGKDDIESFGIANYNEECRGIVMKYSAEWRQVVTRLGRWIDFDNDYKTMDTPFMESVWWVFKSLFEKDYVYRGYKVMPYSTGCTTPLSNFESNLNYKEVRDPTVIASFPLVSDPEVALLAWTTTPWTLPSNLALCVNPDFDYVKIEDNDTKKKYILLQLRLCALYPNPKKQPFTILETMKGKDLVGLKYTPLFDYFKEEFGEVAFKVCSDSYVTSESGTGIVHQAPGFGEDDFRVCLAHGITTKTNVPCPIDSSGKFTSRITDFVGKYVKDADKDIMEYLKKSGRLVVRGYIDHKYPFCWRSETPLLYRTIPSWFVKVQDAQEKLVNNNEKTYWVPDFVKKKRFHNWLSNARDWAISRNRYWGTPLPVWVSDDYEEVVVIGSIAELEELTGTKITDIHRHFIDDLVIPSKQGKGTLKRVPEVFDCWFESGSMPYAQLHYPFENKDLFDAGFPADFIAEGIDQTRGWFYTLLVISTLLFDKPPFKNLIVNGLVLAADGKKMSKRLKNYPDPVEVISELGADALRLYVINSPVVRAEDLKFQKEGVQHVIGDVFLRWYNAYRLFVQNVHLREKQGHSYTFNPNVTGLTNPMDQWILAYTQSLLVHTHTEMKAYRLYTVVPKLVTFISDLANWYVRLNRNRLKGDAGEQEQQLSLDALGIVLFTLCKAMAPFTPFFTDYVYQNLKKVLPEADVADSVHYLSYPEPNEALFNEEIERRVTRMQDVIGLGRQAREGIEDDKTKKGGKDAAQEKSKLIPMKQPLSELIIYSNDEQYISDVLSLESYILAEVNVRKITIKREAISSAISFRPIVDQKRLGARLKAARSKVVAAIEALDKEALLKFEADGEMTIEGHVITTEDVSLAKEFRGDTTKQRAAWNADVLILLDVAVDPALQREYLMREVVNRIQRLRKASGLLATDSGVSVTYEFEGEENSNSTEVVEAITAFSADIESTTHTSLASAASFSTDGKQVLGTSTSAVNSVQFKVTLYRSN
eukprot:TRINITY_DN15250_c0_g1_i1.p1 TRINITY_DN15250_c0_g1~~TRINITY_DN15250_c0_g1_i1.p1  ORF type:complete len:1098 (-),score=287.91 TRINITY_DN15250_c0_g1_i1:42-3311(-)